MDFVNPPRAFILVDGRLAPWLFRGSYRRYADSIELKGDEAVLEFGCGGGGLAVWLAPRLRRGSLVCVDISPPMIEIAARRLRRQTNATCRLGRIEDASLEDGSFDIVVAHNALHDVAENERRSTATEFCRVLRAEGRLYLREPIKPSHGMPSDAYRALLCDAGLRELRSAEGKRFPIGPAFDAVFEKPGPGHRADRPAPKTSESA